MMVDTQSAFENGLTLLDGASCSFTSRDHAVVCQDDDSRGVTIRHTVPFTPAVLNAALQGEEDYNDAAHTNRGKAIGAHLIHLLGEGIVFFCYYDKKTEQHGEVVLTLDDVRQMLTVMVH
jgi:hypothetical protein